METKIVRYFSLEVPETRAVELVNWVADELGLSIEGGEAWVDAKVRYLDTSDLALLHAGCSLGEQEARSGELSGLVSVYTGKRSLEGAVYVYARTESKGSTSCEQFSEDLYAEGLVPYSPKSLKQVITCNIKLKGYTLFELDEDKKPLRASLRATVGVASAAQVDDLSTRLGVTWVDFNLVSKSSADGFARVASELSIQNKVREGTLYEIAAKQLKIKSMK